LPNRYDPDPDVREGQLLAEVARLTERLARLEKRDSDRPSAAAEKKWYREVIMMLLASIVGAGGTGALVTSRSPTPERVDNQGAAIASMKAELDEARTNLRQVTAELRELKSISRERTAWDLELYRAQGIQVRRPSNLPEIESVEIVVPLPRPGRITKGPTLQVLTPPPSP
jgi:hypothetical protein